MVKTSTPSCRAICPVPSVEPSSTSSASYPGRAALTSAKVADKAFISFHAGMTMSTLDWADTRHILDEGSEHASPPCWGPDPDGASERLSSRARSPGSRYGWCPR